MKQHDINYKFEFIQGYYIQDSKICKDLITYFKKSPEKQTGSFDSNNTVNTNIKDSTDCKLLPGIEFEKYCYYIQQCFNKYASKYTFAGGYGPSWGLQQNIQIQHYKPGQGYHAWHYERAGVDSLISTRHLVFMTYLNTVNLGGETEFYYQKLSIKPEQGLTLIWPVDWTFTHRGLTSYTEDKYIVTGWMNYQ